MAFDYSPYQDLVDWALQEYGESVTFKRLTVDYNTIPPTETWTLTGTIYAIIQPLGGGRIRQDPGVMADSTHQILAAYDSGLLVGDQIYRTGDTTNYYMIQNIQNWTALFRMSAKYVAGAV